MYKTFDELKVKLSKYKGQVVSIDVKCSKCERITQNAGLINVDDFLEDISTEFQFYKTHFYTCNTCHTERRLSFQEVRKVKAAGSLEDHIYKISPYIEIAKADLWSNTFTNNMIIVNSSYLTKTLSNMKSKVYIPMDNVTEELIAEEQKKYEEFKQTVNLVKHPRALMEYILKRYECVHLPTFKQDENVPPGLVFDFTDESFVDAKLVELAYFTSFYEVEAVTCDLDRNDPKVATSKTVFNSSESIVIAFRHKVTFNSSIMPRQLGEIVSSSNPTLIGQFIELRLNPLYGVYMPIQISKVPPTLYKEE